MRRLIASTFVSLDGKDRDLLLVRSRVSAEAALIGAGRSASRGSLTLAASRVIVWAEQGKTTRASAGARTLTPVHALRRAPRYTHRRMPRVGDTA